MAPRTFHNYRLQVCRYIIPILGKLKLKALKPHHVQRLYRDKLDSGLSPTSVRYIHAVLRRALSQARRWKCVPHNVTEDVDLPKVAPKKGEALKSSEAKILLDAARGDRLEALYVLAVSCGLRQGELLALRWSDLDLEAATLHVSRQIQRMRDGSGLAFLPLKNCKSDSESERTVILGPRAIKALRRHRQRQSEEKLMLADAYKDQGLIFATYKGTPREASNLVNRSYKPLLKRAGLPKVRFHDLRYTCATLMAHQGVSPRVAQNRPGHADISMTMGIYTHVTPDAQTQAARAIEDALDQRSWRRRERPRSRSRKARRDWRGLYY